MVFEVDKYHNWFNIPTRWVRANTLFLCRIQPGIHSSPIIAKKRTTLRGMRWEFYNNMLSLVAFVLSCTARMILPLCVPQQIIWEMIEYA